MRRAIAVLTMLAAALVAHPAHAVSGGTDLPIAQAPYVAWLGGRCTGTLISPTRILTAAHCVDGQDIRDAKVLVGVDGNTLDHGLNKLVVPVRGYSVHPGFKEAFPFAHTSPQNAIAVDDVGLILLKQPVRGIAPIRLAGADDIATQASVLGYGATAPFDPMHPQPRAALQQGPLAVISAAECGSAYPRAIQPTMLCTADRAHPAPPFVMACPGDSGGPVVAQTPAGPVQLGITSWGPEVKDIACGRQSLPNVAMRVSSYRAFIDQPKPAIEPFTTGTGFHHTRIVGVARIGNTVTCTTPKLAGTGIRLSYLWQVGTRTGDFLTLRHAHGARLKITKAIYAKARPKNIRILFCTATARNAGGSLNTGLTSTRMKP